MLEHWGRRIWTFPELLLAPEGQIIKVYTRGTDYSSPIELEKKHFAAKVWKQDAHISRQVDPHTRSCLLLFAHGSSLSITMRETLF